MKRIPGKILILFTLLLSPGISFSQDIPFGDYSQYPFLKVDSNVIVLPENPGSLYRFYLKLCECQLSGRGKVKILHIGDSHIQADFFSGQTRQRFHETFTGCNGGLNLVFPYKAAKTNSSYLHTAEVKGEWTSCRNVMSERQCMLGVCGMSVSTSDSAASLSFRMRRLLPISYFFNGFILMTVNDSSSFSVKVPGFRFQYRDTLGNTVFHHYVSDVLVDSTTIFIVKEDTSQKQITITGILLDSGDDGIIYNSVGVNGADVRSFLRCNLFNDELQYLAPDLVIISLGTNDCYSEKWDSTVFERNLTDFAINIKARLPETAIIFTTPPDHYRKRRHNNTDVLTAINVIFRVAKNQNAGVWDLFTVMGGLESVSVWLDTGLAVRDRIHFNKEGYILQGNLLFEAIMKSWSDFLDNTYVVRETN
jgi:lysophospholipase L1-like esterase